MEVGLQTLKLKDMKAAQGSAPAAGGKFRERTLEVFSSGNVDAATQNRAIQKIRDSYRVSDSDKAFVNSLKR